MLDGLALILTAAAILADTSRSVPLSVPTIAGLLLNTRIRYCVPAGVVQGKVALIVPAFALLAKNPITVGAAKLPTALDNCAI